MPFQTLSALVFPPVSLTALLNFLCEFFLLSWNPKYHSASGLSPWSSSLFYPHSLLCEPTQHHSCISEDPHMYISIGDHLIQSTVHSASPLGCLIGNSILDFETMLRTIACSEIGCEKKNKEHINPSNFRMNLKYQNNVLYQVILQNMFLSRIQLHVSFLILTMLAW